MLAGLLGGGPAGAALAPSPGCTRYLQTTGNDAGSGSAAAPWRTVNASLPKLRPGNTIVSILTGTGWVSEDNEVFNGRHAGLLVGKSMTYGAPKNITASSVGAVRVRVRAAIAPSSAWVRW